ncbi:hypothetical protein DW322_11165 [Rhodococcus rhodnii]|nr:hypothetical protein DW322_11165 [Rhodococcus rhodnii]
MVDSVDKAALELVGIVHGEGSAPDVEKLVRGMTWHELVGLAISCAAMVDPDRPMSELLAWMDRPLRPVRGAA